MEEYILIFRHEDGEKVASPEQLQLWMKQTMDWIGGIAAAVLIILKRLKISPVTLSLRQWRPGHTKASRKTPQPGCTMWQKTKREII